MEDDGDDIVVEPGHTDNQSVGGWGQRWDKSLLNQSQEVNVLVLFVNE